MPQPFVETLALQDTQQGHTKEITSEAQINPAEVDRASAQSLRPASCSLSAASFANGEFGSIERSRSRGALLA
jgi:hypothetical protein